MPPVTIDFSEPIPVFPLPQCVLLPHTAAPLHIFEARYLRMTQHALASRRLVAMAVFEGDDWKTNYQGNPPLRPHVCVGVIAKHEMLEDGRYNLLLSGVARATIGMEVSDLDFRAAILRPVDTEPMMEIDMASQRQALEALLNDKHLSELSVVMSINRWRNGDTPTTALIDQVALSMCEDNEQKYRLLAEESAVRRAQWLEVFLRDTRRSLVIADHFKPPPAEHYASLN